jgi:hypothetical protein
MVLPPKLDHLLTDVALRVLSRELVLNRFTTPKERISSLVIDFLVPEVGSSTEGVGVVELEEEELVV